MVTHSPIAWEHVKFKDVAVKVKSQETLYKGISFYLEEHPDLLNDLLKVSEAYKLHIDDCHLQIMRKFGATMMAVNLIAF